MTRQPARRAQTELPAIGIAFVLLTAVLVLGIGAANSALTTSERPALEQQAAVGLSDQLTADSSGVTVRPNVLDDSEIESMTVGDLETAYGLDSDHDVRIQLDDTVVAESGDPTDGTTIDRLVVVEKRTDRTLVPNFEDNRTVTLPQRATNPTIEIDPPTGTVVRRVRADDRIVLQNETGLRGSFEISLSRFETQQLRFDTAGSLASGDVEIEYDRIETRKATLAVTIDA